MPVNISKLNYKGWENSYRLSNDLIDLVVESGFDILNPVQWPAGGHTYQDWKDKVPSGATSLPKAFPPTDGPRGW